MNPTRSRISLVRQEVRAIRNVDSAARFNYPNGVAVDSAGNVYVADTLNSTIRKIAPAEVVTTLAGDPTYSGSRDGPGEFALFDHPEGIAVDPAGNVYVADSGNSTIRKITPGGMVTTLAGLEGAWGSDDGTGSAARFSWPPGVAVDSAGNVYVANLWNNTFGAGNRQSTGVPQPHCLPPAKPGPQVIQSRCASEERDNRE